MTRRIELVTFEVVCNSIYSLNSRSFIHISISLHSSLLYAVSPDLRQNIFVGIYIDDMAYCFGAFRIHIWRGGVILNFPICALGNYILFLVPFLLCLVLSTVTAEARNPGLSVLGYLSVKRSVHQSFFTVFSRFSPFEWRRG